MNTRSFGLGGVLVGLARRHETQPDRSQSDDITGFQDIIVFFEPAKKPLVAELKEIFGKKIILVEDRPISLVAGLMSFCKFVVVHNTDLFQLSVALKTPTVAVLSEKEIIQWSPGQSEILVHLSCPDN